MTDNKNDIPPQRKTLTAGKLSLNKPVNLDVNSIYSSLAKNTKGIKTNVAVEVKKNVALSGNLIKEKSYLTKSDIVNNELENRIKLLQNAALVAEKDLLLKEQNASLAAEKDLLLKEQNAALAVEKDLLLKGQNASLVAEKDLLLKEQKSETSQKANVLDKTKEVGAVKNIVEELTHTPAIEDVKIVEKLEVMVAKDSATKNISNIVSNNKSLHVIHKIESTVKKSNPVVHAVIRPGRKIETSSTSLTNNVTEKKEQPTPETSKVYKTYKTSEKKPSQEDLEKAKKQDEASIKNKQDEQRKLSKSHLYQMMNDDYAAKNRSLAAIKRSREKEKRKLDALNNQREKIYKEVILPEVISVSDLANRMSERVADVIKELMKLGIIATSSKFIDADVAELIIMTLGHSCKRVTQENVESLIDFKGSSDQEQLTPRPPIVTVMGHVDHGKTSLLDALKETDCAAHEYGGITQHIGAYQIHSGTSRAITFIDTPGHEAFSAMRSRGAKATDIVVLVVAADDGIKTQTIEAIGHIKSANLPIIVAINKIDKPDADIARVKQELLQHEIVSEDFGGEVMMIPISATKKLNLVNLEDAILLLSEMMHLQANASTSASGIVLEAQMHKSKGILCSLLIQNGTLNKGDFLVVGSTFCKVKTILNDKMIELSSATPSTPVEVFGFNEMPGAGDRFVVTTERKAKLIAQNYADELKEKRIAQVSRFGLNELILQSGKNIKELLLIIKTDTQGSFEAIENSIAKIITDEVRIKIIHSGAGNITESDINLAETSGAMILGFNVKANANASQYADRKKIEVHYYNIIYNLLDEVKQVVINMLSPIIREEFLGTAEIRQIFEISKLGKIAGSYITKGTVKRNSKVRLLRDDIVIFEGTLKTLKRFKDDVREVRENFECGIALNNYDDLQIGDIIEAFEVIEEKRSL